MRRRGFTLIEVLVVLTIMAIIAVMAWQGIDGISRARGISQQATERTLRLSAMMNQWELDLSQIEDRAIVPALAFDGRALRLSRRTEAGVQIVVWSLQEGTWMRWASPSMVRGAELQEIWMRSQQLQGTEPQQVKLLEGVRTWQVYFYRGTAWTNAQSTGDAAPAPEGANPGGGANPGSQPARQAPPSGVRLVIELPEGTLTRDVLVRAASA